MNPGSSILIKHCLKALILLVLSTSAAFSSHVIYTNLPSTYTIGSVPVDNTSFYYNDGRGNFVSIRQSTNIPVIISQFNQGQWIVSQTNQMPYNAIVIQYINGYPIYACRILYRNQVAYGQMLPHQGCFIPNLSTTPFTSYQLLVR